MGSYRHDCNVRAGRKTVFMQKTFEQCSNKDFPLSTSQIQRCLIKWPFQIILIRQTLFLVMLTKRRSELSTPQYNIAVATVHYVVLYQQHVNNRSRKSNFEHHHHIFLGGQKSPRKEQLVNTVRCTLNRKSSPYKHCFLL